MWLASSLLILLLAAFSASPACGGTRVFVANSGDDTVSVIDADLDREIEVIEVGSSPQGLALRGQPPLLAIANSQASHVTLIDPLALVALADTISTGRGPEDVAFSRDGKWLFATSYYDRTVTVTDVGTRTPVGDPIAFSGRPRHLLPSADGTRLFVLLSDAEGAVAVVDLPSRTIAKTIPVGPFPTGFVLTPDGSHLFAGSFDANQVTVIRVASLEASGTLPCEVGQGLAIHPSKPLLYAMLSFDNEVFVFDYERRQKVTSTPVGAGPTAGAMSPDGRFLYVVNNEANNVVKVDTESNTPVVRIAVGMTPEAAVVFAMERTNFLAASASRSAAAIGVAAVAAASVAWWWIRRRRARST